MKRLTILSVLGALAVMTGSGRARAEENVDGGKIVTVAVVGAADVVFVTVDVAAAVEREWPSRTYGAVEGVAGAAQVALFAYYAETAPPADSPLVRQWTISAICAGALAVHGLVTLLAPRSGSEPASSPRPLTVAPVALAPTARGPIPGLALFGRF